MINLELYEIDDRVFKLKREIEEVSCQLKRLEPPEYQESDPAAINFVYSVLSIAIIVGLIIAIPIDWVG